MPTPGSRPHDPRVTPDGSLWYTGQFANVLGRLDPRTGQIKEYHLKTPNAGPHGLTADQDGNIWYTGNFKAHIGKLNPNTGEVDIGKTTMVDTFVAQATAQGAVWSGRGQCIDHHGAGEAYLPVLDALARLCRDPDGGRVTAVLYQYAPTWLVQMPWLLSGAELDTLQRRILGSTRERMLRELAEAVEALSRERALLLVLEDLHWSDAATVDLLGWLARRRDPARLLLIGTFRPVDLILGEHPLRAVQQELARQRCCVELAVELLAAAEVAEYLAARCPVQGPQVAQLGELATIIHQRTDGHPLFMVTLVDYLVQRGWLAAVDGQWQVQTAIAAVERGLPYSLRQDDRAADRGAQGGRPACAGGGEHSGGGVFDGGGGGGP